MYGYDGAPHVAEFVEMAGRVRNAGFETPRMGAVSNRANGVLTMSTRSL
jgi:hypothetical protein